jgi:hypothetical protein
MFGLPWKSWFSQRLATIAGSILLVLSTGCGAHDASGGTSTDGGPTLCISPGSLVTTTMQTGSAKGQLTVTAVTPDPANASKTTSSGVTCDQAVGQFFSRPVGVTVGSTGNFPVFYLSDWTITSAVTGEIGGPYAPGCSYSVTYFLTSTSTDTRAPIGCKWTVETTVVLFN